MSFTHSPKSSKMCVVYLYEQIFYLSFLFNKLEKLPLEFLSVSSVSAVTPCLSGHSGPCVVALALKCNLFSTELKVAAGLFLDSATDREVQCTSAPPRHSDNCTVLHIPSPLCNAVCGTVCVLGDFVHYLLTRKIFDS